MVACNTCGCREGHSNWLSEKPLEKLKNDHACTPKELIGDVHHKIDISISYRVGGLESQKNSR